MTKRGFWDTEKTIEYSPAAVADPPITVGWRDTPQGQVGWRESDVVVPALQSLLVSVSYASLAGALVGGMTLAFHWPWHVPVMVGLLVLTTTTSLTMTRNVNLRQELWWGTEEIVRRDLDGDGVIGKPEPTLVRVEVVDHERKMTNFVDLGCDVAKLQTLAHGLIGGRRPFSEPEWVGKGKTFSRREFYALRSQLLSGKLLAQKHPTEPKQGYELTLSGKAMFRKLAAPSPD